MVRGGFVLSVARSAHNTEQVNCSCRKSLVMVVCMEFTITLTAAVSTCDVR